MRAKHAGTCPACQVPFYQAERHKCGHPEKCVQCGAVLFEGHCCFNNPTPDPLMRHVPEEEYQAMLMELVSLRNQADNCRRIIKRMGFLTDHPRLEDSLILFAFEAQFWEQDAAELRELKKTP